MGDSERPRPGPAGRTSRKVYSVEASVLAQLYQARDGAADLYQRRAGPYYALQLNVLLSTVRLCFNGLQRSPRGAATHVEGHRRRHQTNPGSVCSSSKRRMYRTAPSAGQILLRDGRSMPNEIAGDGQIWIQKRLDKSG